MSDLAIVLLALGAPIILILGIYVIYRRANRSISKDGVIFYHFGIGGSKLVITKKALTLIGLILIPVVWFSSLIPLFSFSIIPFILIILIFWRPRKTKIELSDTSQSLLKNLKDMQGQIEQAKMQIELLVTEVGTKQVEAEEKTLMNQTLEVEINNKLEQYDTWRSMSDAQKELVISAAKEALSRRSAIQIMSAIIGSIILNLVAIVIWTLAGSPGRDELLRLLVPK